MKKRPLNFTPIVFILVFVAAALWIYPFGGSENRATGHENQETLQGVVMAVTGEKFVDAFEGGQELIQVLDLKLPDGEEVTIENDNSVSGITRQFAAGDKVSIVHYTPAEGEDIYYILDYVRTYALMWLFIIFVCAVVLVTRWGGLGSLIGMFLSFIILFKFVLPQILSGASPVLSVLIGSILIVPLTFFSAHGINRKSSVAVLGTFITLIFTGALAVIFTNWAHLTGLASEEATYLQLDTRGLIDFKGLVLAGIIISVLGILDDITISQASVVQQLKGVMKKSTFGETYKRAMSVGQDHIWSMVNTVILVYTGASLPLLLLFVDYSQPFLEVINYEFLAKEIVQTLVGSIGLVLAVPITTALAVILLKEEQHG